MTTPKTIKTTHKPTSPKAKGLQDALHAYHDAQSTILDNLGAVMSYCQSNRPSIEHCLDHQDRALLDAYTLLEPLLDSDKRPLAYCEQVSDMLDLIAQTLVNRLDRHKQGFILGALDHIEQDALDLAFDHIEQDAQTVASGKPKAPLQDLDHIKPQDHIEHTLDPLGLNQDAIEQATIERVMCFANIEQAQALIAKASSKVMTTPKQARDALVYAYNLLEHTHKQTSTPKQARLSLEHALDALLFGGALELDAPSIEQDTIEQAQANITHALDVYRALFGNIERTLASVASYQDSQAPKPSSTPLTAWGGAFVSEHAQDHQTAQDHIEQVR
jgi:hypothetical protein